MWIKTCVYYHTQVLLCNRLIFKAVLMSDNSNLRTLNGFQDYTKLLNIATDLANGKSY